MDGAGSGIAINIISTAIWVLSGAFLAWLYRLYKTSRETVFNRFAQMPYRIDRVHLTYGLIGSKAPSRAAKEGDVSAICSALAMLQERFGTKKVSVLGPTAALAEFGNVDNLISISGPVWNPITRNLLNAGNIPVSYQVEEGDDVLVDSSTNPPKVYKTSRQSSIPRECFAIVYRGSWESSAHSRKRHFAIAAGISPLGTFGAVTWLRKCSTQRLRTNPFVQSLKKDEHAIVVLKVKDSSPDGFQAYRAGPDSPGFLTISVVSQYNFGKLNQHQTR